MHRDYEYEEKQESDDPKELDFDNLGFPDDREEYEREELDNMQDW